MGLNERALQKLIDFSNWTYIAHIQNIIFIF